jgi:hypothetical protein
MGFMRELSLFYRRVGLTLQLALLATTAAARSYFNTVLTHAPLIGAPAPGW